MNGKMERYRRGEQDGVLTFGKRRTMAAEKLAGVGEDDGADIGFMQSTTPRRRARREELHGGVGFRRKSTVSPEKLAGV